MLLTSHYESLIIGVSLLTHYDWSDVTTGAPPVRTQMYVKDLLSTRWPFVTTCLRHLPLAYDYCTIHLPRTVAC